jgi:DNA-binding transcriptional ArsR family regulator
MRSVEPSVFELLAEPNRRRILDLLREGKRAAGELHEHLPLAQRRCRNV